MTRRSWVTPWIAALISLPLLAKAVPIWSNGTLTVNLSVAPEHLDKLTDTGHVSLMFNPYQRNPAGNYDVTSTPNAIYGKNVFDFPVTFSGGSSQDTSSGVYGYPNVSLNNVPPGIYGVQAYWNQYETVTRSDGSIVSVRFPCGDGAPPILGYGTLKTDFQIITVTGGPQMIDIVFQKVIEPREPFEGSEIGGCHQGNYEDTPYLKHLKIRSTAVSEFWGRDMYVGANILLPHGYNSNSSKRYPVIYSQGHWPGGEIAGAGSFNFPSDKYFAAGWKSGVIPGEANSTIRYNLTDFANATASRRVPEFIIVVFRHECPFYDDSYAVNTANIGPYGDAINDELIPLIDQTYNTIPEPYARIQEGGSTGGWESAASLIFRPDLFGATFSSYPDSLDFRRHQAIPLQSQRNAYHYPNGTAVPDIRAPAKNGSEISLAVTYQENHWELTFGTSSRSFLQWDAWNAVFGVQGYNNYPLEPWDKLTGEIYREAVDLWRPYDLSHYITDNWDNEKNLGEVLKNRIFIYVGSLDTYYLNLGVEEFEQNVNSRGGSGWANITILEGEPHGGVYQLRDIFDYLKLLERWVIDHGPNGKTPLRPQTTTAMSRGNRWSEVLAHGGHQAAVQRQASPTLELNGPNAIASTGRWDPGVQLTAQWLVDGKPATGLFRVNAGEKLSYRLPDGSSLRLNVTGKKRGYETETRQSQTVGRR